MIERTLKDDLDIPFGGGNTALHLATFLGAREVVKLLLERGSNRTNKNGKGFAPLDIVDGKGISLRSRPRNASNICQLMQRLYKDREYNI